MNHEQIISQRLKPKEVPDYRKALLRKQNNICPLCGNVIRPDQAVLDHDHGTGRVRAVLHRACNQAEGRVLSWANRTGQNCTSYDFIRNLLTYWTVEYEDNKLHPSHKSEEEQLAQQQRKRLKKLKSPKHRAAAKAELDKLLQDMKL